MFEVHTHTHTHTHTHSPPQEQSEVEAGVFNRIDASKLQDALENASMLGTHVVILLMPLKH